MADPDFIVAIPARYAASRLPGKPLRPIAGEPMVVHVARRALAAGASEVVVATDDERIAEAVRGYPLTVCMTRREHASGTDRLAECARKLGWPADRIVVNLQGDEPFAPPEGIRAAAQALADGDALVVGGDHDLQRAGFQRAPRHVHDHRLAAERPQRLARQARGAVAGGDGDDEFQRVAGLSFGHGPGPPAWRRVHGRNHRARRRAPAPPMRRAGRARGT